MRGLFLVGSGPVGSGRARVMEFSYNGLVGGLRSSVLFAAGGSGHVRGRVARGARTLRVRQSDAVRRPERRRLCAARQGLQCRRDAVRHLDPTSRARRLRVRRIGQPRPILSRLEVRRPNRPRFVDARKLKKLQI